MLGAFSAIGSYSVLTSTTFGAEHPYLCLCLSIVIATFVCSLLNFGIERIAFRPIRHLPRITGLISSLGISIVLQNVVMLTIGSSNKSFPVVFPEGSLSLGNVHISYSQIFILGLTALAMVSLSAFDVKTKQGKALRAVSEDKSMARAFGINIDKTVGLTFIIAGSLAAIAGVSYSLYYGVAKFDMGFMPGIKAFTAAIFGGVGNYYGAIFGGLFIGLVESLTQGYVSSTYKDIAVFGALILVLVLKPEGLLGARLPVERLETLGPRPKSMSLVSIRKSISFMIRKIQGIFSQVDLIFDQGRRFYLKLGLGVMLIILPFSLSNQYYLHIAILVGIYMILALGLNVVVGFSGLLDLGYIAFYAVGAYTCAILTTLGWNFWIALPIGALFAMLFSILIGMPTIRTRGDYLAIVTLGFGEIVRLLVRNWDSLTNGPKGIMGIAPPSILGITFNNQTSYYYLVLVVLIGAWWIVTRLRDSHIGRSWRAIRDDEEVASSVGINVFRRKLDAFAIGALLAGLAGGIFASVQTFVGPESFTFFESITILCIVVIGGQGSVKGSLLAALLLVALPEVLRGFGEYRMLLFGGAMLLTILMRPQGLIPWKNRSPDIPVKDDTENEIDLWKLKSGSSVKIMHLSKSFGGVKVLNDVNLEVKGGEILGLVGPNGAGKTTLFNCITGTITKVDKGSISLERSRETPIEKLRPHIMAERGIGRTFQNTRLFSSISIIENIMVANLSERYGILSPIFCRARWRQKERNMLQNSLKILRLLDSIRESCGALKKGYDTLIKMTNCISSSLPYNLQKQVEIGRALATSPKILLLDEPFSGLSPEERGEYENFLKQLRLQTGMTMIVVEHDPEVVEAMCDRVYGIVHGEIIAHGSPIEVYNDPVFRLHYCGENEKLIGKEAKAKVHSNTICARTKDILKVCEVSFSYGSGKALTNANISVKSGEITWLIGPNGAGKTTLFSNIIGLLKPQQGRIEFCDEPIFDMNQNISLDCDQIISKGIAIAPEGRRIFTRLSIDENLEVGAYLEKSRSEILKRKKFVYGLFGELYKHRTQSAGKLSGGQQQMLSIARALMACPKLLLLDEPSLGLDPKHRSIVLEGIQQLNNEGTSILIAEQKKPLQESPSHQKYFIQGGTIEKSPVCLVSNVPSEI